MHLYMTRAVPMNPRRSMRLDGGSKNQEVENCIRLVPFFLCQRPSLSPQSMASWQLIMRCQRVAFRFGRLWIEFWLPMARTHSSTWVIWFWPLRGPRIVLITKLVNVDVIRKYVVAQGRLRGIVRRYPSRARNPLCKFVLTCMKLFSGLHLYEDICYRVTLCRSTYWAN